MAFRRKRPTHPGDAPHHHRAHYGQHYQADPHTGDHHPATGHQSHLMVPDCQDAKGDREEAGLNDVKAGHEASALF